MRASADLPRRLPVTVRRGRWALVIAVVALALIALFLQRMAKFYTDFLWFRALGFSSVWSKTIMVQLGLGAVFTVILFAMLWPNLVLADRLAPTPVQESSDALVARWQEVMAGRSKWARLGVAIFFAVVGGVSAHSQWDNWLLFSNSTPFSGSSAPWGGTDPLNHLNDAFYVFTLPFLDWLVGWVFAAVVLTLLLCLVAHYLNGGVRPHAVMQRVSPRVKAHFSVLLAVLALVQGVSYYLDRLSLVLSTKYVVDGATYTDVHATRPALILLIAISVIAAGLFLFNARQQGWLLPSVAVVLWGLVWVLVANVLPAIVQSAIVKPAENVKEAQYIERNIAATTYAYGLSNVAGETFTGNATLTASDISGNTAQAEANRQTLANVRLLDPNVEGSTITNEEGFWQFYEMSGPSTDRYDLPVGPGGKKVETQVLISARELSPSGVPNSWVNTHLQYTHGYGAVVTPANQAGVNASDGYPDYSLSKLPPQGQPSLGKQPRIYYDTSAQVGTGYVVAATTEPELDYEDPNNSQQVSSHYSGPGGVSAGGFFRRLAFAVSFGDYKMLLSGAIHPSSKVLYYRNVTERLQKAAPFLSYDSDPYPVVVDGSVYWVEDAYTTTDNFPYSEQAGTNGTARLQGGAGDLGSEAFNYIRNSVKAVVNAYTGKTWFFVMPTQDPIITTYQKAFPHLFTPVSQADKDIPGITSHWRYPEDLFTVQTDMYAQYHQQNASVFYSGAQEWTAAENPASGEVGTTTTVSPLVQATLPPSGTQSSGSQQSALPQYELTALPGQTQQSFVMVQPFIPSSTGDKQNLTAFMTASSDPNDYGQLTLYTIPAGQTIDSPYLFSTEAVTNRSISKEISLWGAVGSKVVLGTVILTPLNQSLLYIQPLYVEQRDNGVATLEDVIVNYDGSVFHSGNGDPSLDDALCNVTNPNGSHPFSLYCSHKPSTKTSTPPAKTGTSKPHSGTSTTTTSTTPGSSTTTTTTTVVPSGEGSLSQDLAQAKQDYADANAALRRDPPDFATYENDLDAAEALVAQAAKLSTQPTTTSAPASTSTTTTRTTTTRTTTTTTAGRGKSRSTVGNQ